MFEGEPTTLSDFNKFSLKITNFLAILMFKLIPAVKHSSKFASLPIY